VLNTIFYFFKDFFQPDDSEYPELRAKISVQESWWLGGLSVRKASYRCSSEPPCLSSLNT